MSSQAQPRVAVLGLGTMGTGMAHRIAEAGLQLTVWNRSAGRTAGFAEIATAADSPARAVATADVVVTMLFDADAVAAVMAEALPAMRPGAVWVQASTIGVEASQRFADQAAQAGIGYLDAPVLGTKGPAAAGTLTVLAAGSDEVLAQSRPVLAAISAKTVRAGDAAPAGSALKVAINAWLALITAGMAQSLSIAAATGIDPSLVLEAIDGAAVDSAYARMKGTAMLLGDFAAQFEVAAVLKDVRLAIAAAPQVPQELLSGLETVYQRTVDAGAGRDDIAAVWKAFQRP